MDNLAEIVSARCPQGEVTQSLSSFHATFLWKESQEQGKGKVGGCLRRQEASVFTSQGWITCGSMLIESLGCEETRMGDSREGGGRLEGKGTNPKQSPETGGNEDPLHPKGERRRPRDPGPV